MPAMSLAFPGLAGSTAKRSLSSAFRFRTPCRPCRKAWQQRCWSSTSSARRAADGSEPEKKRRPRVVFSGIQPTGVPHLGNYLGALQNWVRLQNAAEAEDTLLYSVVGLHAITLPQDPERLAVERKDMLSAMVAVGLDPERCIMFQQDEVSEHAELAWIFNCLTSVGRLQRMTTWKSRLAIARNNADGRLDESSLLLGLLAYPVLQAADILLYKATHVPVGDDQVQHLELTRDIAQGFNKAYGSKAFFPLPEAMITPTKRVLSLRDPSQKMSKSAPQAASRILITDAPSEIVSKIGKAVTDTERRITYEPATRPGVSNLLLILSGLTGESPERIAERMEGSGYGHKELKDEVTAKVIETLEPIGKEFERVKAEAGYLEEVSRKGRERAKEMAMKTMGDVRRKIGLGLS